jgi:hypothetical protein
VFRDRLRLSPLLLPLVLALLVVDPATAGAQTARSFRLTWAVEKTGPIVTEVAGRITNDARVEAIDVYVTVEGVDDKGKVLARGLTHVGSLRPSETDTFLAKVPVVPGIQAYRANVSSFRFGLGAGGSNQAP